MDAKHDSSPIEAHALSGNQKQFYRDNGYLVLERIIPDTWLDRLRAAAEKITADTGQLVASTRKIALRSGHSAQSPNPSWVWNPDEDSNDLWAFLSDSVPA